MAVWDDVLTGRDRELYEGAMQDLKKSRFTAARINLNILLDTYESSEYSALAKYAVAESFYREAGHSNLLAVHHHHLQYKIIKEILPRP